MDKPEPKCEVCLDGVFRLRGRHGEPDTDIPCPYCREPLTGSPTDQPDDPSHRQGR